MRLPLLPSDLQRPDPLRHWRHFTTAQALAKATGPGHSTEEMIARIWGNDEREAEAIRKAAASPASLTGWGSGLAGTAIGAFLKSLRPRSAAAQLFTNIVSLDGLKQVSLPRAASDWPEPTFIAEGAPIPATQGSFASVTLGPPSKLALLAGITAEVARYSAEDAEQIVTELVDDATSRALDKAVFSATAASAVRPAGLLNGVSATTAASGGGLAAMVKDIQNLVGAIVAAGGGSSIAIFAHPAQAVALNALAANGIGYPVIPAPSLTAGTVIAIEQNAIASGFGGLPEFDMSREAVIHFEDTSPAPISTAGTPNAVAAPVRSAFQQDMLVLRMILRCAWVSRAPGMVQFVNSVTW